MKKKVAIGIATRNVKEIAKEAAGIGIEAVAIEIAAEAVVTEIVAEVVVTESVIEIGTKAAAIEIGTEAAVTEIITRAANINHRPHPNPRNTLRNQNIIAEAPARLQRHLIHRMIVAAVMPPNIQTLVAAKPELQVQKIIQEDQRQIVPVL